MSVRVCMFCGSNGMTSAHIISQSLQKLLQDTSQPTEFRRIWRDQETLEMASATGTINIRPGNHQVKRMCHKCNGEWMAAIERDTKALIVSLSQGSTVSLGIAQQEQLASWAVIASMLRATQEPGDPHVTTHETTEIRATGLPPAGFSVWLVRGEARTDVSMRHFRGMSYRGLGWSGWVWINEVIFMVASGPLAEEMDRRLSLIQKAARKIYPSMEPTNWPTPNHVSSDMITPLMSLVRTVTTLREDETPLP